MPNERKQTEHPEQVEEEAKLRAAYDEAKRVLTQEQLQPFEIEEEMFPFEDVLAELEAIHHQSQSKGVS